MARSTLTTTATAGRPYVSKSKFLWGSQCRKLLWFAYNAKEQIPEPDAATQAIFDQSHEVVALAKSIYPTGIEVSADAESYLDFETFDKAVYLLVKEAVALRVRQRQAHPGHPSSA